jgi:pantoate--beta-alanine ligase
MRLVTTVSDLQSALKNDWSDGQSIGFVPTMGALHEGHLALVDRAGRENDIVVVSIFVNPTQFNDKNDLKRYPRNLEKDTKQLSKFKCDYVFAPSVEEVYPVPDTRKFNFGNLETVMEGRFRPGHFNGVAQVVSRLFDIVKPGSAYFGLKDFQQLAIIKELVRQLKLPIAIIPCDIVRETDGLAKSSRNTLLTPECRKAAPLIHQTLVKANELKGSKSVEQLKGMVINEINANPFLKVEYFEIVDETQLMPIISWLEPTEKVGCIAVFAGTVRLIDNIKFDHN